MIKAVKRLPFIVNLLIVLGLAFLVLFLILQMLGWFTKHGEHLTVPSVIGKNTNEAVKFLEAKGFEVQITDSTYTDTAKNGIVLKQIPDPNSTVKVNRTVFLVVNRYTLPLLDMPKLDGLSLAFALDQLDRNHLKLQDTLFKPDIMNGTVIEQQLNGLKVQAGAKVPWGSKITLIVGLGLGNKQFMVPDLIGMTFTAASKRLDSLGILAISVPDYTIKDSNYANTFVVKQRPARFDDEGNPIYISSGMVMDLWISKINAEVKDSVALNKVSIEELNKQAKEMAEEKERIRRQKEQEKLEEKKTNRRQNNNHNNPQ